MVTVAIQDKYADTLTAFGSLQEAIDTALQRYTIEQITTKINELRQRAAKYQKQYGCDYPSFAQQITTDETFVQQIEANISKLWEIDLADWEFCYKGIEDWTRKLETNLSKSSEE
jgi:hypothetical protein